MRDTIPEFVARENIRRFEDQIARTADDDERNLLLGLLREEHAKLQPSQAIPKHAYR